mgnify:FL=1
MRDMGPMNGYDDAGQVRELAEVVRRCSLNSRQLYAGLRNRRRTCRDEAPGALWEFLYDLELWGECLDSDELSSRLLKLSGSL